MHLFSKWLFKSQPSQYSLDLGLLLLRMFFGLTLSFRHGWPTLINWWKGDINYPDPIGLGENLTMLLMGTAEAVFALFIAFGFLTRFSSFSLAIGFAMAFFVVHAADPFAIKELPFFYFAGMSSIFILGPGRISFDYALWGRKSHRKIY